MKLLDGMNMGQRPCPTGARMRGSVTMAAQRPAGAAWLRPAAHNPTVAS